MLLSLSIFLLSLVLIIFRPRPFREATAAALGAFLMLALGVVGLSHLAQVFARTLNILLFFLGLMVVSAIAERAGFFHWAASKAVGLARGSGWRLLLAIFAIGTLITAFLSNDATALALTPVVYILVTRLKLNPLPYVFACAFVANTASILLPISNPVNLLPVDAFRIDLREYLRYLLIPGLLALGINAAVFGLVFRRDLQAHFEAKMPTVKRDPFLNFVSLSLVLMAVAYVVFSLNRWPLSLVALGGAAFLFLGGVLLGKLEPGKVARGISWPILLFIFSLALMVRGLQEGGVTSALGHALANLFQGKSLGALLSVSFISGLGSNLINNWSMMMVSVSSLQAISNPAPVYDRSLVYGSILGADLGPNLTILGSLSSMLWLLILRSRGLDIQPRQYLKLGLMVTPAMLLAGSLAIYLVSRI